MFNPTDKSVKKVTIQKSDTFGQEYVNNGPVMAYFDPLGGGGGVQGCIGLNIALKNTLLVILGLYFK